MTDAEPPNPIGATTNGDHRVTDAEPSNPTDEAPQYVNGSSIDDRLDALLQMIRTWNWRAAPVATRPPPAEVAASTASPLTTPAFAQVREDSATLTGGAASVRPEPQPVGPDHLGVQSIKDTQPVAVVGNPRHAKSESALEEPEGAPDVVALLYDREFEPDPEPVAELERKPEPDHFLARVWSHHRFREAVFGLAAVVVVLLVIAGIRLVSDGNTSSGDSFPTTTVTQPASRPAHHIHFVAPISAAELAKYEGYADGLQQANTVAAKAIVSAGRAPTPTQLSPVITAYGSALNLYDFQLHFIQWPATMLAAIEDDHAQLKALMSFMQSFTQVSPTGVGPWLSQFHQQAGTAQSADNQVRHDLGLSSSSSFPS